MIRMSQGQRAATGSITRDSAVKAAALDHIHPAPPGSVPPALAMAADKSGGTKERRTYQSSVSKDALQFVEAELSGEGKDMMDVLNEKIEFLQAPEGDGAAPWRHKFDLAVCGAVVLNVITIAIEMDFGPSDDAGFEDRIGWWITESLFTLVFIVEILLRVYWDRWSWVRSMWNWFDVFVVACAIIDVWLLTFLMSNQAGMKTLTILRIVRLVRLVRMVKLVRTLQSFYCIMMALWHALHSMLFLGIIMLFGVFIYSIFATVLIGRSSVFEDVRIDGDTVDMRFGTVYRSMYSLFELMTLEGWEAVARPLVTKQPLIFLFIGSFIMVFTFGMLNMIVAVVVEKTLDQTRQMTEFSRAEARKQMAQELTRMKCTFLGSDQDNDGKLTLQEFNDTLRTNEAVQALLRGMGIPDDDASELFRVLDWNGDDEVTIKEFMQGIQKIQVGVPSPWDTLATHAGVRVLKRHVSELDSQLSKFEEEQRKQGALLDEVFELLHREDGNGTRVSHDKRSPASSVPDLPPSPPGVPD